MITTIQISGSIRAAPGGLLPLSGLLLLLLKAGYVEERRPCCCCYCEVPKPWLSSPAHTCGRVCRYSTVTWDQSCLLVEFEKWSI